MRPYATRLYAMPTKEDPFRSFRLTIIDVGEADHVCSVESEELNTAIEDLRCCGNCEKLLFSSVNGNAHMSCGGTNTTWTPYNKCEEWEHRSKKRGSE